MQNEFKERVFIVEPIYIYENMPDDLEVNGAAIIDWLDVPEITRIINREYSFYGNYSIHGQNRNLIKRGSYVKALWSDGTWQYFKIKTINKDLQSISFTATHIAHEANRNFIQYSFTSRGTGKQIMANLKQHLQFKQKFDYLSDIESYHQFTAEEVNPINAIIGQNNGNQNLAGVTSGELDMDNYNLILKKRIGTDNGYRIDLGVNLESIKETIDDTGVFNSLYLKGGEPEDKVYDDEQPPITYKYLEISGVTDENRRITKRENSECKTIADLKQWGQSLFDNDRIHEPKVTHEINMISLENTIEYAELYGQIAKLNFGDTIHCDIEYLGITNVEERMIECVYLPTLGKYKSTVIGNDLGIYTDSVQTQVSEAKKELQKTAGELTQSMIQATELINGVQGGAVYQHPKNKPYATYYLDSDSLETAKDVLVLNNQGLGFSRTGWKGPFRNAWTIDGRLNADFIKTGVLEGVMVRSANNDKTGKIELNNGHLDFFDFTTGEFYGRITPSSSSDGGGISVVMEKNKYFSLHDGYGSPILEIPKNSNQQKPLLNTMGTHNHKGDLYIVGKLFVNGQEVKPGSGGGGGNTGGWNGQYPPEVTTDAEKFAWQAWVTLLSMGYSKAAAAGILGNINGEAGPSMNPDTEQVGGPAYGAVQFDGSRYPLIGSPTNNGREYFQRLHTASGVGGDYREMSPQMKVVDWATRNGQWIGAVSPTTIDGFKSVTSPEQAANAFELNFERPASAHPERQGYARKWYDKFVNLEIPSSDWLTPVRSPYVVTQEWDQIGWGTSVIHGGIDLAPTNGGNPPIYAAKAGTVIVVGNNAALEGNYVMIDHKDGYYTYYGHMVDGSVKVSNGQSVTNQTVIGLMGATGLASGVHLHFEVRKGGQSADFRINPRDVIKF